VTDSQLRKSFEDCSLAPERFSHEDHIQMAWIYVSAHPLSEAIARFRTDLRRFVKHAGAEDKYHETITWFYLVLVNERANRLDPEHSWECFKKANGDLLIRGTTLLKTYYRSATLESTTAKHTFVLPDALVH